MDNTPERATVPSETGAAAAQRTAMMSQAHPRILIALLVGLLLAGIGPAATPARAQAPAERAVATYRARPIGGGALTPDVTAHTADLLRHRFLTFGFNNVQVRPQGNDTLVVSLPLTDDLAYEQRICTMLGAVGLIELIGSEGPLMISPLSSPRDPAITTTVGGPETVGLPAADAASPIFPTIIQGTDIPDASLEQDPSGNNVLRLTPNAAGRTTLLAYLGAHSRGYVNVVADKRVINSHLIVGVADTLLLQGLSRDEMHEAQAWVRSGPLPVVLELLSLQSASAGLTQPSGASSPNGPTGGPVGIGPLMWDEKLVAADAIPYGSFGHAMAVSADGTTAIVGAPRIEGAMRGAPQIEATSTDSGAAYIFTRTDSFWSQQQVLLPSDSTPGDCFGFAVALSADGATAIVGAPARTPFSEGKNPATNAAYVFTRSGTRWTQQQKLATNDTAYGDLYGYAVAVSADGTTAAIGAAGKNNLSGAVYIFTRSGDQWAQQQELVAPDSAGNDTFGNALAVNRIGDTVVIGALGKHNNTGAAYIFTRNGPTWSQQQELVASDVGRAALFGDAVALSEDGATAMIGAPEQTIRNVVPGAVYIFTREGDQWNQRAQLTPSGAGDTFGYTISLSSTGDTAVIGEYHSAFTFARLGTSWSQQQQLDYNGTGPLALSFYGSAVAISGDGSTVLVGAQTDDDQGAVYSFT